MKRAMAATCRPQDYVDGSRPSHWRGGTLFAVVLLYMIDGLPSLSEMALFAGHAPIPMLLLRFFIISTLDLYD